MYMFYDGALHAYGSGVCSGWYFTFDSAECTKPATIEGIVYVASTTVVPHRHSYIEGYCSQVRFLKVTYVWTFG